MKREKCKTSLSFLQICVGHVYEYNISCCFYVFRFCFTVAFRFWQVQSRSAAVGQSGADGAPTTRKTEIPKHFVLKINGKNMPCFHTLAQQFTGCVPHLSFFSIFFSKIRVVPFSKENHETMKQNYKQL